METNDSHIDGERRFYQCLGKMEQDLPLALVPGEDRGKARVGVGEWEGAEEVWAGVDVDKEETAYALSVEQHCSTKLESPVTLSTVLSAGPL